jgi:hypothetical protein
MTASGKIRFVGGPWHNRVVEVSDSVPTFHVRHDSHEANYSFLPVEPVVFESYSIVSYHRRRAGWGCTCGCGQYVEFYEFVLDGMKAKELFAAGASGTSRESIPLSKFSESYFACLDARLSSLSSCR